MSCEQWLPLLVQAAEDERSALGADERDALTAHLAQCAACREALDEQRAVRHVLRKREDAPVPLGFATRLVSKVTDTVSIVDRVRWRVWTLRLAPLAACLLLFGIVTSQNTPTPTEAENLSDLTEVWAFGHQDEDARPAFTLLGQADVSGDLLLDAILSVEPDEPLPTGEPS